MYHFLVAPSSPTIPGGPFTELPLSTGQRLSVHPKRLGGELGMTAVLHTWGQNLSQHVYLHCLVPGGVLTKTGHWRGTKGNYLFPVRALSRHFRGRMVRFSDKAPKPVSSTVRADPVKSITS